MNAPGLSKGYSLASLRLHSFSEGVFKEKRIFIPIFPLFQMSTELCLVLKPGASQNVNVSGNYVHGKAHSHKSECFPVLALDCMVSNEYNREIS